jgi:hypothetical protein
MLAEVPLAGLSFGHEAVIEGIFEKLRRVRDNVLAMAG